MSEKGSGGYRIFNLKTQMWLKAFAHGGRGVRCYYFTKEYKEAKVYKKIACAQKACERMPESCVVVDGAGNRIQPQEGERHDPFADDGAGVLLRHAGRGDRRGAAADVAHLCGGGRGMTGEEIMEMIEDCLAADSCVTCPQDRTQCDQETVLRHAAALINVLIEERDAAIADLKRIDMDCDMCAHNGRINAPACEEADCECMVCKSEKCECRQCIDMSGWAWRGVQDGK